MHMLRHDPVSDLKVLGAVAEYVELYNKSPAIRDICMMTGIISSKAVWLSLKRLEAVGAIKWKRTYNGTRTRRGIELVVPLKVKHRIPIIGYLGKPTDFVPGSRWIEITKEHITINEKEYRVVWHQAPAG